MDINSPGDVKVLNKKRSGGAPGCSPTSCSDECGCAAHSGNGVSFAQDSNNNSKTYKDYASKIGDIESTDNYQCVNQYGYMGRYQMGNLALIEAGYMDFDDNWTEYAVSKGVNNQDSFLNNPSAQDDAFKRFNKRQWGYIVNYGLDSYIGTEFNGTGVTITPSGLLTACHLVGVGEMNAAFNNGTDPVDANGTYASRYMDILYGYDISEVMN